MRFSLPPHRQKQPIGLCYHEKKQGVKEGMVLVRKNVGQSWSFFIAAAM